MGKPFICNGFREHLHMVSSGQLIIVTLNTWKNGGNYPRRLQLMADQLKALAPDLVALQEVFVAPEAGAHTGDALATALAMDQIHEAARPGQRRHGEDEVESTSGLSLLSRIPIDSHQRLELPADSGGERVAIAAWTAWNDVRIAIVALHLTYQPDAHALRRRQLQDLIEGITNHGRADAIVLAGDFNAEPDSPPLVWLREDSGFSVSDAWDAAGGPRPTMTEPPGSTTIGSRCIDHILLLHPPGTRALNFVAAKRVLDCVDPESGILPSDHAGLRAVLSRVF
jgi:endonuclease/exonuclease/phosphatase family metal-dependent hydrolase